MSTTLSERPLPVPARTRADGGGAPARRAVIRWAWRLFRREWRQQLLVLALITAAVLATVLAAAVSVNTPPPASTGFGTATDLATYHAPDPNLAAQLGALRRRFGRVEVIENEVLPVPGSVASYDLRAQSPRGAFSQPMLALVSGQFPAGPGQVALTRGLAADLGLRIGSQFSQGGVTRRVTGIVTNPQDTVDEFALVLPGQLRAPTQVTALFSAPGVSASAIGPNVQGIASARPANVINPETISVAAMTVGMLLVALVAAGGFTVLAQRRLRSLGMLQALGATDRHVRMVVRVNGAVVGAAGALAGAALAVAAWLACRPALEASAHHEIGTFALPWPVVAAAMVLAVAAAYGAAARPARQVTRIPVTASLAGRPLPPQPLHRSAVPGAALLAAALVLFALSAASGSGAQPDMLKLVLGLIALITSVVLLSPFGLTAVAALGRRAPVAVRLALRDLARYRSRSGPALAAISVGVLLAVVVSVLAASRYANVLDYAGPNLAGSQLVVYTPAGRGAPPPGAPAGAPTRKSAGSGPHAGSGPPEASPAAMARAARGIAAALGASDAIQLSSTDATLLRAAPGRNWHGAIYVATPQLLRAFGISAAAIRPDADILTMRPGLATTTKMQLLHGSGTGAPSPGGAGGFACPPSYCLAGPPIQQVTSLPSGTSAPNTVITEHAVRALGLKLTTAGWLIQAPHALTAGQISSAQSAAAAAGLVIETRSSVPSVATIINWATVLCIALALGILAMTVGLIRSEAAADLRTLTATGASPATRRTLTAVTAGALALTGAVLGTVAGYVSVAAWIWKSSFNGGLSALSSVPLANLLIIVVGLPLAAAAAGWLLAGREPPGLGRQPAG
ncbi:MAG TPA: FtsX-like permease family protein [Streptosporangiaceae bacterium]|nr:FtsX-like permease family protein [Streptosporangiaceae bacterium]